MHPQREGALPPYVVRVCPSRAWCWCAPSCCLVYVEAAPPSCIAPLQPPSMMMMWVGGMEVAWRWHGGGVLPWAIGGDVLAWARGGVMDMAEVDGKRRSDLMVESRVHVMWPRGAACAEGMGWPPPRLPCRVYVSRLLQVQLWVCVCVCGAAGASDARRTPRRRGERVCRFCRATSPYTMSEKKASFGRALTRKVYRALRRCWLLPPLMIWICVALISCLS